MSDGDHELLYDRPIPRLRYLDWQAGVRTDLDSGPARVWGVIGMEGLVPYALILNRPSISGTADTWRAGCRVRTTY